MVGQPVLGKVVGADSLAAVSGADQAPSLVGAFLVGLLLLGLEQPTSQHPHRLGTVLVLALLVLALDHGIGWQVSDPDGAGGLVDLLPARSAGKEGVHSQVVVVDLDLDVVGLRQYGDGGSGGVDSALSFCGGNPLHTVATTLELQLQKGTLAGNRDRDVLEAAEFGGRTVDQLGLPPTAFDQPLVHVE